MEIALLSGKIYLKKGKFVEALLIKDGLIEKVGSNDDILAAASGDAKRIELGGKTVVPGFNDSHMHLANLGNSLKMVKLHGVTSMAEIIERGKKFIEERKMAPGTVIAGRGWNQDYFTDDQRVLTRHDLDKISTEHAIVFTRACGHMCTANTKALEMAGITKDTPQVDGGEYYLDEDGTPNGVFAEHAQKMVTSLIPVADLEEMVDTLLTAMKYASSFGVTSLQTNDIKDDNYKDVWDAMKAVYERDLATLRVYEQCCFTNIEGYKKFLADGYYTGVGDDYCRIGPLKLFVDGSLGARTALMRKPYEDEPTTDGILCMTQEELDEFVKIATQNSMSVAVHAIGDKAIEMVLDAYDTVIHDGFNPLRHGIVHCQITDEPLVDRFKTSDVYAYVQPIFIHYDMHAVGSRVGKELESQSYAFGSMGRKGIHVGYGTDAPVEDINTWNNLYCAVTRKDLTGNPAGGYFPDEKVDIETAIDYYTIGSAYASYDEAKKGRLMPGWFADLVVLDRDIFTIPEDEIKDVKAAMTMMGGKVVYEA